MKWILTLTALLITSFLLLGCTATADAPVPTPDPGPQSSAFTPATSDTNPVTKVEIFHFHGTNQCYSCVTMGAFAEETVNTYFAEEVASGKIRFAHVNGELPANRDLVVQYGATGSSLWIGVYKKDGTFTAEQNVNVWYKINDKPAYLAYLKGIIEQKLAGK